MTFSFVHPSYRRPKEAYDCFRAWVKAETIGEEVLDWNISLSSGDPTAKEYVKLFDIEPVNIVSYPTTNMVSASNAMAKEVKGDIIILVSDDMYPCHEWDEKLLAYFKRFGDEPAVLQVHDGNRCDILTIPIMNRAAYEMLGYLYHPSYMSMFADNDLTETARKHGIYYNALDIQFDHRHYTAGKSKLDVTYQKENSRVAWDHGQRTFELRKRKGFPIDGLA